jgi:hypothetical protein
MENCPACNAAILNNVAICPECGADILRANAELRSQETLRVYEDKDSASSVADVILTLAAVISALNSVACLIVALIPGNIWPLRLMMLPSSILSAAMVIVFLRVREME